jgi:hypothetical protein
VTPIIEIRDFNRPSLCDNDKDKISKEKKIQNQPRKQRGKKMRRYFILADAVPKSEIPHMLGRVVEDKTLPMRSFAPVDPGAGSSELLHNPEDIIADMLPAPVEWRARKDFFSRTSEWRVEGGLADLVSIAQGHGTQRGVALESEEIRCYSMANTFHCFETLMANDSYARDVGALLERSKSGHAYFVTGFLTAKGGLFTEFQRQSRKSELEVTAPVLTAIAPGIDTIIGGAGNPYLGPGFERSQQHGRSMEIVDEVIFAVAYDVIRGKRSLALDSRSFLKRTIQNAGPKRAKARHLAFAPDEDDSDEDDQDGEEFAYVDTTQVGSEQYDDQAAAGLGSFQLQVV